MGPDWSQWAPVSGPPVGGPRPLRPLGPLGPLQALGALAGTWPQGPRAPLSCLVHGFDWGSIVAEY